MAPAPEYDRKLTRALWLVFVLLFAGSIAVRFAAVEWGIARASAAYLAWILVLIVTLARFVARNEDTTVREVFSRVRPDKAPKAIVVDAARRWWKALTELLPRRDDGG